MRFKYSVKSQTQSELYSLPRLPLTLSRDGISIDVVALVDSGATMNVLPYHKGVELGAVWDEHLADIQLMGSLGDLPAMLLHVVGTVGDYSPVKLVFAWSRYNKVPIILGQVNFFMEFEVHFYRFDMAFEIKPK
jgi:hypothetical protein